MSAFSRTALASLIAVVSTGAALADPILLNQGVTYTQNFNSLSNVAGSTTNTLVIPGWAMTETGGGARDNEQYAVDTGSGTTGDTFSYGSAGSTDRALGGLRSGTLIPVFGAGFTNNTGSIISSLLISYFGEQWRVGAVNRPDRLDFQYSLNATDLTTGNWVDFDLLDYNAPQSDTVGAKDGNVNRTSISSTIANLSIASGSTFWIRWTDFDAAGADDGLAVDDFSIRATALPEPGSIALAALALAAAAGVTRRRAR